MYRNFFEGYLKIVMTMCLFFCVAFVAGSVFCAKTGNDESMQMQEFLTSFLESAKEFDFKKTALAGLYDYLKIFGLIFACSFFKPGGAVNSLVLIRRGFMTGYSFTSFLKVFSEKGILGILAQTPEIIIFLLVLLIFSSTSTKFAFFSKENKKKFFVFFIIFSCFSGAIFCGLGIFKGYLTTTFMKWAAVKIL